MTSSTSSSSRRRALVAAALALGLAAADLGCAARGRADGQRVAPSPSSVHRIAVFPLENVAAAPIPARSLVSQIERALAWAGVEVVTGDRVQRFLEHHRLRYTGGIDGASAAAARDELGVEGILFTSVGLYGVQPFPRVSLTMRLVSASEEAAVEWTDGTGRTGDDSPGLLGLGLISEARVLEQREVTRLVTSLSSYLAGTGPRAPPCASERRFRPKVAFRSRQFDPTKSYSVAVLPFVNQTERRAAGEIASLELMRQLATVERLRVVEPGVVRAQLLRYRVIMEGGISVDTARAVLDILRADLVFAGYIREYKDAGSGGGDPALEFTVLVLEREHGAVVWESTSHNKGNDGVFFFDRGRISTANALACRMARSAVVGLFDKAR